MKLQAMLMENMIRFAKLNFSFANTNHKRALNDIARKLPKNFFTKKVSAKKKVHEKNNPAGKFIMALCFPCFVSF
jgi:methyltransferase-like protein